MSVSTATWSGAMGPGRIPGRALLGAAIAIAVVALVLALASGEAAGVGPFNSRGEIIVVAIRTIVPLLIFRYWFAGGVAAMVVDLLDVVTIDAMSLGGFGGHYSEMDKALDSYYLAIECFVAWKMWSNPWVRLPALLLFAYRTLGVVLFEVTHTRVLLFIFPNMFENWWLYCVIVMRWFPGAVPRNWKALTIPMIALLIPKMGQEYVLHFAEVKPWGWIKDNIL